MQIGNIQFNDYPVFLAPLEDITDLPFRRICKRLGADMMYTEFISSEGLIRDAKKSTLKLDFLEEERPIGIQIFGHETDSMIRAAEIAEGANPDLIDINWGCPVRKVTSKGGGAGMLRDIDKMAEITRAVVDATSLPVTVKTRLGWDEDSKDIIEIAERLQDTGIKAISIHGRTRNQLYRGTADWTLIGAVKNNPRMQIPVVGNGDIDGPEKAKEMIDKYGVDGIMIGRAAIGYPWIFKEIKHYFETGEVLSPPNAGERVKIAREHLKASIEYKGERKGIFEMRKFLSNYFKGLSHFKTMKIKILTEEDPLELFRLLDKIETLYD